MVPFEEPDTKRIDYSQAKKENGDKFVSWEADAYPLPDFYAKAVVMIENCVGESASKAMFAVFVLFHLVHYLPKIVFNFPTPQSSINHGFFVNKCNLVVLFTSSSSVLWCKHMTLVDSVILLFIGFQNELRLTRSSEFLVFIWSEKKILLMKDELAMLFSIYVPQSIAHLDSMELHT